MAVIFAVVGAGAVYAVASYGEHSDYSDHSDYSNYGDYSNYSDAAERLKRRMNAKNEELNQQNTTVDQYKIQHVNSYLKNRQLINEPGRTVSLPAVKKDGDQKIMRSEKDALAEQVQDKMQEVKEIDAAIAAIDKILEANDK